ncbi:amino acid adenylation domain-containing protein [[Clostridium] fimetarium]|uniref:Amino acid adenylation domain-containing protein n=1 Tax=[Clostridium] fimetarium TaxID=99656 RepID=A0A1I0R1T6_9FIRM|nr:amino acid adenylation domain-containing protein [[Clostridium] fimetarium]SEW34276.1 amino acid adenylation domain-containing protein [[Clostridium] fimetarium]
MVKNILGYLEESTEKFGIKAACSDENSSYTYNELSDKAKRVGSALIEKTDPRNPVPIYMDKSCSTLAAFMGTAYAGCFYVMLDVTQPPARVNMILDTLEAKFIVVSETTATKAEKLGFKGEVLVLEELMKHEINEDVLSKIRKQTLDIDPLYSIFTSGSTGVPKGVIVSHRSVIDFIDYFTEIFNITDKDVIGNQAPFDFDVSVKDIYSSLKTGATLQIIPKKMFSFPINLLDYLEDRKVTTLVWAVSALCIVTTLNGFEYKVPSAINKVIFSGEVMPIKHLNSWRKQYPDAMFVNVYGPTEITCNCTYYIIDREFALDETIPMGQAFPNEKVFLLDEDNTPITPESVRKLGEICVSGTALSLGYFNNKEKTEQAFVQNPLNTKYIELIYRTGDLGAYNEKGEMYFSSRKDFQIKHMGHRIELGEIETAINAVEGVSRVCCTYDQGENKIVAFIEGATDKKVITHELSKKLPKFMVPNIFAQVHCMPITKNGKIDRKQLMEDHKKESEQG